MSDRSSDGFVHLHVHSEYSLLDGAARINAPKANPGAPTIFTEAQRLGMSAVAVTDHGSMFSALPFFEAGRASGVKPILGVEAYVAPGSRFDRNPGESEEKYYHLTLLARERDRLPEPAEAGELRPPRGLLPPPPHGQAAHGRIRRGHHLHVGVPVQRDSRRTSSTVRTTRRRRSPASTETSSGPTTTSSRSRITASGTSGRSCAARSTWAVARHPGRGHQRSALHAQGRREAARRPALHPAAEGADRHEASSLRFRGVLPQERRGDARGLPRAPRGVRQHPGDRGALRTRSRSTAIARPPTSATTCPGSRPPGASIATSTCGSSSRPGRRSATARSPPEIRARIDHELGVITSMGFGGYFLIVWD